jgi:hypothetical protein
LNAKIKIKTTPAAAPTPGLNFIDRLAIYACTLANAPALVASTFLITKVAR